jgi:hypothetical protein
MNEVFPEIQTVPLAKAEPGSIAIIPRSDGPFLALVTDQPENNGRRAIVIFNTKLAGRPPVLFSQNWIADGPCLTYKTTPRFNLGTDEADIDAQGHNWSRYAGPIVSIGDQLYVRAIPFSEIDYIYRLINIRTGSLFTGQVPNSVFCFGVWQLLLRDKIFERDVTIFNYDIHKYCSKLSNPAAG